MKRIALILFTLLASAIGAQEASRQAQPVPVPLPIAPKCSITVTDVEGVADNFGGGLDQTTTSPGLTAFLNSVPPRSQYDDPSCDKHFGESFRVCSCETCGGTLEIQVRRCSSTLASNDGYTIGIAPFALNQRVASGLVWTTGDPPTKTLTIPLPAAALNKILCGSNSQWLDVYIQDDTIVDSMKLTLTHP